MTTNSSRMASIDYSSSSLRYGLMDVRPIEIKDTIKRFGIKFRRIRRGFEFAGTPKTYAELVTFENEAIINSIEIPTWFDPDKLIKELTQHAVADYEKDEELKNAVEELKKSERIGKPLLSFVQFAKNRFESQRDIYLKVEADRFLRSNFPLSFYNKFVIFDNTYWEFLKFLEDKVRKSEFVASCARNFEMYKKRISEMRMIIGPLIDQIDSCFFHYSRVKKYVSIWNAKDYNSIFDPKFLDFKNIDYAEFNDILQQYDLKLSEIRKDILQFDDEALKRQMEKQDEGTRKVFGNLINLSSDFSLQS